MADPKRILGFGALKTGLTVPVILKNIKKSKAPETVEGQGEDGKTDEVVVVREVTTITCDGDVKAGETLLEGGDTVTVGQDVYLVKSAELAGTPGGFQTLSLTLERKDSATVYKIGTYAASPGA